MSFFRCLSFGTPDINKVLLLLIILIGFFFSHKGSRYILGNSWWSEKQMEMFSSTQRGRSSRARSRKQIKNLISSWTQKHTKTNYKQIKFFI